MPDTSTSPPAVEFRNVSKSFGEVRAVDGLSLTIAPGEFFSLLGPSGCGKSTTLRLLAGLEDPDPDGGIILVDGADVAGRRPYERRLSMVFQSYALFPHLTVERNVAFGLEQRRIPKSGIRPKVRQALDLVRLDPDTFARRRPAELSGGQRQRVALARALVLEPAILLLDEPLGAIDLRLRKAMQLELKALNRRLGITFLYVTHDQEEALTMSDRIAVMDGGRVMQVGTPAEVYESPRTAFVADFIGESNLLEGRTARTPEGRWLAIREGGGRFLLPEHPGLRVGAMARIAVRPEWMDLASPAAVPAGENALPGTVRDLVYRGEMLHLLVEVSGGQTLLVAVRNEGQLVRPLPWHIGDQVAACWRPEDCQILMET
jgi:spermidine/putrescine ABC transporter ATP-binding subunit